MQQANIGTDLGEKLYTYSDVLYVLHRKAELEDSQLDDFKRSFWLMFLFDCRKRIDKLPEAIDEGAFRFVSPDDIFSGKVKIPDTDRLLFWDIWRERRGGGLVVLSADCRAGVSADVHEVIFDKNQ